MIEAVTLIAQGHVPDEAYEKARAQFSEEELINLTMAVVAINGWNRLNISFRTVPGSYQPATARSAAKFDFPFLTMMNEEEPYLPAPLDTP